MLFFSNVFLHVFRAFLPSSHFRRPFHPGCFFFAFSSLPTVFVFVFSPTLSRVVAEGRGGVVYECHLHAEATPYA